MLRPFSKFRSALPVTCFLAICFSGFGLGMPLAGAEESVAVGLKPGDPLGTFRVIKIAGAKDDGVEVGQSLCYRCRYGSNPIVMVFARKASTEIDSLIGVLEKSVEKSLETQQMQRLCAFVVLVGQDRSELNESAVALIQRTGAEMIPAVVTEDATSGPLDYQLSSANDVTVVVAKDSQVVAVETFGIEKIEPKRISDHIDAMLAP
ncbi:hypothetical protein [Rubripirellula obstinata]|nr:hypothetical protein [Rubripirellula obstinata]